MALTIDQLVAITKSRLQIFGDSMWDELLLDEAERCFDNFRNRETLVYQDACVTVCSDIVELPVRASQIEHIRFFQSGYAGNSQYEVFFDLVDPYYSTQFTVTGNTYYYNGTQVKLSNTNFDGYEVVILFQDFMMVNGERVLPNDYNDSATAFMMYRYYLYNPSPVNIGLADRWKVEYVNKKRMLAGIANKSNTEETQNVQGLTNGVKHSCRFNWGGSGFGW